jgi:hypothetical protein
MHDDSGVGEVARSDSEEDVQELPYRHRALACPETWQDAWSSELVTAYQSVRDLCAGNGWALLEHATFHDFASWAWTVSSRVPNVYDD